MFTFTKKQSTIPSSSLSEKSPLISHVENNNDNSNKENHQKQHKISFSQLRPFLKIAIPYFRYNKSGIIINLLNMNIIIKSIILLALCTLICLLILTILDSFFSILFSYTKRNLLNALGIFISIY